MPTLEDRPAVGEERGAKTLERPRIAPPVEEIRVPRRPERYMRWMGWMLALLIVGLAIGITAVVISDDTPAANLGATLEQRLAKDAIEEKQQAVLDSASVTTVDRAAIRLEALLRKDAIEEQQAAALPPVASFDAATTYEARMLKERIEDSQQR